MLTNCLLGRNPGYYFLTMDTVSNKCAKLPRTVVENITFVTNQPQFVWTAGTDIPAGHLASAVRDIPSARELPEPPGLVDVSKDKSQATLSLDVRHLPY